MFRKDSTDGGTRNLLAISVVLVGTASVVVLAIVAVATAPDEKHDEAMQFVLTAILPLMFFMTATADPSGAVVGWVTNVTISQHSRTG